MRCRAASGTAALLLAALGGCGSSLEEPVGRFVFSSDLATPNASRLFVIGADGKGLRKVTRGRARVGEGDADWSPDSSRIVFDRTYDCVSSLSLCSALWVVNADGTAERRLTSANAQGVLSGLAPTWSPDGRRIAYELMDDSGASDLWVMNADGSAQRRVTRVGDAEEPAWAPDGRRLAFSHDGDIVSLNLDTGSLQRLTKTPALFESYPDWSPDGEQIAYELNDESPPDQSNQEYDAYVMRADGTDARRLSRPVDVDGHPVWSPGGELIAYGSDVGPVIGDGIAIVIVDAGSGDLVRRIAAAGMDLYPIDWAAE